MSGTDEASGPAEDHDEQRESERAMPKPGQEIVRVRISAGKVIEIKREEDDDSNDEVDIDGMDDSCENLSLEDAKSDVDEPPVEGEEATCYRSVMPGLNYSARSSGHPIQYQGGRSPHGNSESVSLGRFDEDWKVLRWTTTIGYAFQVAEECDTVTGLNDSDWAGCMATARSTSGGTITIGTHAITTYSRQQKTKLHAMVVASAEALGAIGLYQDLGMQMMG